MTYFMIKFSHMYNTLWCNYDHALLGFLYLLICLFISLIIVSVQVCASMMQCVCMCQSQEKIVEIGSLLPPYESQGYNSYGRLSIKYLYPLTHLIARLYYPLLSLPTFADFILFPTRLIPTFISYFVFLPIFSKIFMSLAM